MYGDATVKVNTERLQYCHRTCFQWMIVAVNTRLYKVTDLLKLIIVHH